MRAKEATADISGIQGRGETRDLRRRKKGIDTPIEVREEEDSAG